MEFGISTYTLPWSIGVPGYDRPNRPMTAESLLMEAHTWGIQRVQFGDNLPLHELDSFALSQLHQTARELNITIEVGMRGTEPHRLRQYIEICQSVESKLLRTLITTTDIIQAEHDIRSIIGILEKYEIQLVIENHGLHSTQQLIGLFESLDSRWVGGCLDTVNSFGALESPDEVICALMPYAKNVHIKDFDIRRTSHQMGYEVLGTPAGHGRLDIARVLSMIKKQGNQPTLILELWPPYSKTVEETIQLERQWFLLSIEFLRDLKLK